MFFNTIFPEGSRKIIVKFLENRPIWNISQESRKKSFYFLRRAGIEWSVVTESRHKYSPEYKWRSNGHQSSKISLRCLHMPMTEIRDSPDSGINTRDFLFKEGKRD